MRVVVVGCGIVGAAIAFELSQVSGLSVTVLDAHQPAQASTGAALGVLMGAISQKPKGNNLRRRLFSIQQYNEWIPKLETLTGRSIPFNRQGILRLCFAGEDLDSWRSLAALRETQGWPLEICDRADISHHYPQLNLADIIGAVYSPQDRQVNPTALTLALIEAAQQKGVTFQFGAPVLSIDASRSQVQTPTHTFQTDWLIIAAGLGSTSLTTSLQHPVDIRPVLGQALQLQLPAPLGTPTLQPVITGNDIHIVPLTHNQYWLGATVEFPPPDSQSPIPDPLRLSAQVEARPPTPDPSTLEHILQQAIAFCPALQHATRLRQWQGLRPRPEARPAPIIERLPGHSNVILASGHYRNGVLLAPATAKEVREMVLGSSREGGK